MSNYRANEVVDIGNIKHVSKDIELAGDVVEKISDNWKAQRDAFYQRTKLSQHLAIQRQQHQQP